MSQNSSCLFPLSNSELTSTLSGICDSSTPLWGIKSILVSFGCCNKLQQSWCLKAIVIDSFTVWRPKSQYPVDWAQMKVPRSFHRLWGRLSFLFQLLQQHSLAHISFIHLQNQSIISLSLFFPVSITELPSVCICLPLSVFYNKNK